MPPKLKLEDMHTLARKYDGECLSTIYEGMNNKLKWRCSEGHVWNTTPHHIKHRMQWCGACEGNKPLTIEEMHTIANAKGGKCLSKEYKNNSTNLEWMCSEGHRWKATAANIKKGKWCRKCSGREPLSIEEMRQIGLARGGKCLSTEYVNNRENLDWECANGHRWKNNASNIKKGQWCGTCNVFYAEEICRTTFEVLFNKKFPKVKPLWLQYINGRNLEIDGYCDELKIGFEYNGEQHYGKHFYYNSEEQYKVIKKRDKYKSTKCLEHGVTLFIIKYDDDLSDLPMLIKQKMNILGLNVEGLEFNKEINFDGVYRELSLLKKIREIANSKGGVCVSNNYINSTSKLEFICQNGHQFQKSPTKLIHRQQWCPICAGNKRLTIEEMRSIAKGKGGKCLSTKYKNNTTKLEWECARGHKWNNTPKEIKRGAWCILCEIAEKKQGSCLSENYIDPQIPVKWQCSNGHEFYLSCFSARRKKNWCELCKMGAR